MRDEISSGSCRCLHDVRSDHHRCMTPRRAAPGALPTRARRASATAVFAACAATPCASGDGATALPPCPGAPLAVASLALVCSSTWDLICCRVSTSTCGEPAGESLGPTSASPRASWACSPSLHAGEGAWTPRPPPPPPPPRAAVPRAGAPLLPLLPAATAALKALSRARVLLAALLAAVPLAAAAAALHHLRAARRCGRPQCSAWCRVPTRRARCGRAPQRAATRAVRCPARRHRHPRAARGSAPLAPPAQPERACPPKAAVATAAARSRLPRGRGRPVGWLLSHRELLV